MLEIHMLVELLCTILERMPQQSPDSCIAGYCNRTIHSILQQGCPQMNSLSTLIHGKSSQNHHAHRGGHIVSHSTHRRLLLTISFLPPFTEACAISGWESWGGIVDLDHN